MSLPNSALAIPAMETVETHVPRPGGLEELLGRMAEAGDGPLVSIGDIKAAAGERSSGALLGVTGLLTASPLGVIPGLPTTLAVTMGLISAQMLVGRETIWLPQALTRRTVDRRRLRAAMARVRPVARRVDRVARPRMAVLTRAPASRGIALICLLLCLVIPPLELLPFMATAPSAAICAFGLSIFLADGLIALAALAIGSGAAGLLLAVLL